MQNLCLDARGSAWFVKGGQRERKNTALFAAGSLTASAKVMHWPIRRTNARERLLSTVRQRTDQINAFPTETSGLTSVWATRQAIR